MVTFSLLITIISLVLIDFIDAASDRSDVLSATLTSKEGGWGSWSGWVYCDEGQWANTFKFKSESGQSGGDDTAGNGVRLICERPGSSTEYPYETTSQKQWGNWYGTNPGSCPTGTWLKGFKTRVEGDQGWSDDTALNCIQMRCSDGTELTPTDCRGWGSYQSTWSECSSGYICGFHEKYEPSGFADDETGLNAVQFKCCSFTDAPTPSPTPSPSPSPTESPTDSPTDNPTPSPVMRPTDGPTPSPTLSPTTAPTDGTMSPTASPGVSQDVTAQGLTIHNNETDWTPLYVALGIVFGLICCCLCVGGVLAYLWYKQKRATDDVNAQPLPAVSPMSDDIEVAKIIANEGDNTTNITKIKEGNNDYETRIVNEENLLPNSDNDELDNGHNIKIDNDSEDDNKEDDALYAVKKKKSAGRYQE